MVYECGCNSACVRIDRPLRDLKDRMRVTAQTGSWKDRTLYAPKTRTTLGDEFFTLGHVLDRSSCQARFPQLGYLCATGDLGEPRRCTSCPD